MTIRLEKNKAKQKQKKKETRKRKIIAPFLQTKKISNDSLLELYQFIFFIAIDSNGSKRKKKRMKKKKNKKEYKTKLVKQKICDRWITNDSTFNFIFNSKRDEKFSFKALLS